MQQIHSLFLIIHLIVGACALILFWVPTLTKKGSPIHRQAGRYYSYAMYAVAASATVMATLGLIDPLGLHAKDQLLADPEKTAMVIRSFRLFLLYLALLTFTTVRHSLIVLAHKQDRQPLKKLSHFGFTLALAGCGPLLAIWGIMQGITLLMIFGVLGSFIGTGMVRYTLAKEVEAKQWLIEHLGAMIASGIGAYTAFFTFGMRDLLAQHNNLQLLTWILPGIIGTIFIRRLTRQYSADKPTDQQK